MYNQSIYQGRPDDACVTKDPLPPVLKCQAGAGYSVTPGMVISADLAKSYCASNPSKSLNSKQPYKLTLQYDFHDNQTVLTPLSIARALEIIFPDNNDISVVQNQTNKLLTIETTSEECYNSLLDLETINSHPVKVQTLSPFTSKGYFYCDEDINLSESERSQIKEQGVIDFYRVKHTHKYAVTYAKYSLPNQQACLQTQ